MDAHSNFAYSTIAVAPSPSLTGLTLTVAAGTGVLFPTPPFNAVAWPAGTESPTTDNAEIIRVTGRATDVLTIVRAQEGTDPVGINVGDQLMVGITEQLLDDMTVDVKVFTSSGTWVPKNGHTVARVMAWGAGGQGGGGAFSAALRTAPVAEAEGEALTPKGFSRSATCPRLCL